MKPLSIAKSAVPRLSAEVSFERLSGQGIGVSERGIFSFGEGGVGERIVELCDGQHTVEFIGRAIAEEFDVDAEECLKDVIEFVQLLVEKQFLVV
jgi:Coenzyme PQQ synthesis protein D (PqqD)